MRNDIDWLAGLSPLKAFDISLPVSRIESYLQLVDRSRRDILEVPRLPNGCARWTRRYIRRILDAGKVF